VLVQSLSPDHPAIHLAAQHDYAAFAQQELPIRQLLGYPPFGQLIRIVVRGTPESQVRATAEELADRLRRQETGVRGQESGGRLTASQRRADANDGGQMTKEQFRILGPAPCPFPKLRGEFRYQIHVQGADGGRLKGAVRDVLSSVKPVEKILWTVDVDPIDMR
jgi:primosomal protein N' (replication factor Y)